MINVSEEREASISKNISSRHTPKLVLNDEKKLSIFSPFQNIRMASWMIKMVLL
jgi:hypothetical protein